MKDNTATTISLADVTEDLVIEYLCAHPEFFQRHEDLLDNMTIPHPVEGNVVSLIERQVERLRQRYESLSQEVHDTIDIAKENEKLFEATKKLTLALIDTKSLDEFLSVIAYHTKKDFKSDAIRIGLVKQDIAIEHAELLFHFDRDANKELKDILKSNRAICKTLNRQIVQLLFGDYADQVGSLVVIPLGRQGIDGVLAISSCNKYHFHKDMDTLFLDYIGKIVSQLLPKWC